MKRRRGRGKFNRLVERYMAQGMAHYDAYEQAREDDPAAYIRFIGGKVASVAAKDDDK